MRSTNDGGWQLPKFHFPWNKEERVVLNSFFKSIISSRNNHKPVKGSLWSSQLFVTSPHLLIYTSNSCAKWLQYGLQLSHKVTFADPETILAIQHEWKVTLCVINKCLEKYLVQNAHLNYCNFNPYPLFFCIQ